jgi:hypothetical protein
MSMMGTMQTGNNIISADDWTDNVIISTSI